MPTTFAALLEAQTRPGADPGRPLVTWYGDQPGERVELSVTSFANWVAKTASLLQEELDVERGDRVLLDLPTHWLGPVWLGACWAVGAVAVSPEHPDPGAALVACGPDGVARHAGSGVPVVASALDPLGTRFTEPLPAGVVDLGEVVWGQPDAFAPWDPPAPEDPAWDDASGLLTQDDVAGLRLPDAEAGHPLRVATAVTPVSRDGLARLVHPLAAGGGAVWCRDPARLDGVAATEHARVV